jgi:hypothetical protein
VLIRGQTGDPEGRDDGLYSSSKGIVGGDVAEMLFSPQHLAIQREAQLAAEQLGSGVTLLGRASSAQPGLYTQAFFALSIGFERLAKLIVIADHAITNAGRYPTDDALKKARHNIFSLLNHCEELSRRYRDGKVYSDRPNSSIHQGIVAVLSEFAEVTRYYNLDLIAGGKAANLPEPLASWWQRVGQPILVEHYTEA